jgi:hypothetical protein
MARTVEVPEYEVHERVRLEPSRAALLVIDMQNDFVKEGAERLKAVVCSRAGQCLDLPRRALRDARRDPDAPDVRRPEVVEDYEQ